MLLMRLIFSISQLMSRNFDDVLLTPLHPANEVSGLVRPRLSVLLTC